MIKTLRLTSIISEKQIGQRLDQALSELFLEYSRSKIKTWILEDKVTINGTIVNIPKKKVQGGEYIEINAKLKERCWKIQNIALDIIYEDEDILVINKPFNLVVHPSPGVPDNTILNALIYYHPPIINIPRAGIVHRLDKDTTGLMIIAKTINAHIYLSNIIRLRKIIREYEGLVIGNMISGGTVNKPISRHVGRRMNMSVNLAGKPSITHYRIMEHFHSHTRLRLRLETGRTHQIRVHMAHIKHPLVGDPLYGNRSYLPKGCSEKLILALQSFKRQALHAVILRLHHPISGIEMEWYAPIPQDMLNLITILRIG